MRDRCCRSSKRRDSRASRWARRAAAVRRPAPDCCRSTRSANRDLRERFARRAARDRLPRTLELCRDWRPDVLVCDETDFGAMLASDRLGLPFATVLVTATGSFVRAEVVGDVLEALRAEHGLAPDPDFEMASRHLVLSPFPTGLRDPGRRAAPTTHAFRALATVDNPGPAPAWTATLAGRPAVYFTLGTVFPLESGDLFERVLAGLAALPINVLATVGHEIEPAQLGPQPPHVQVERFVPQQSVLPHCDLVVSHAGSGSVLGALAHGLPSLLIPIGADQPHNARRCEEIGVARVLDALTTRSGEVGDAVSTMLADPTCGRHARRLRDEIAALPGPESAVERLEQIAAPG